MYVCMYIAYAGERVASSSSYYYYYIHLLTRCFFSLAVRYFFGPLLSQESPHLKRCVASLLLSSPPTPKIIAKVGTPLYVAFLMKNCISNRADEWSRVILARLIDSSSTPPLSARMSLVIIRSLSLLPTTSAMEEASAVVSTVASNSPNFQVQRLFTTVLSLYLRSTRSGSRRFANGSKESDIIAAMTLLPPLIENVSLEKIFADGVTILKVLMEIFRSFAGGSGSAEDVASTSTGDEDERLDFTFLNTEGDRGGEELEHPRECLPACCACFVHDDVYFLK